MCFTFWLVMFQQLEINVGRKNCFRRDIRLHEIESALCEDYHRSGFDRGHMEPNGIETVKS